MTPPSERCQTCKHYIGNKVFNAIESNTKILEGEFMPYCSAFKNGIPEEISIGDNLHTSPLPNQGNSIVYEDNKGGR